MSPRSPWPRRHSAWFLLPALCLWSHAGFVAPGLRASNAFERPLQELTVAEPLAPKISARPASEPVGALVPLSRTADALSTEITCSAPTESPAPPPRPIAAPTPLRN